MGKIIQNKKGQTTITIPKALVESFKLEKGMKYELMVSRHNELLIRFEEKIDFKESIDGDKEIPCYFG